MDAAQVLDLLAARGIGVAVVGRDLELHYTGELPAEIEDAVRAAKPRLIAALSMEPLAVARRVLARRFHARCSGVYRRTIESDLELTFTGDRESVLPVLDEAARSMGWTVAETSLGVVYRWHVPFTPLSVRLRRDAEELDRRDGRHDPGLREPAIGAMEIAR